ncbi:MAG: Rid family hydrolase [Actinomycetota bacterium]
MTSRRPLEPPGVAPAAANYALAVATQDPTRWLHTSAIVPAQPDGSVPEALADQVEVIWTTIGALLDNADMVPSDVVSVCTYVVPGEDLAVVMRARDAFLGAHRAASTLVTVAGLARPEWRLEIAVIAAA